ncbi:MAG: ATP-grasp domain-containing protein [Clostridiales Family XIII bacterium]|jgi:pyrrolysine biosynthesis protein PylC|nr:ATP-grasp domain-containing protein [Clostridiales Family XIII bacterium]
MRKVVIIGGKLQGVEASYLAHKAGIRSALIDMNEGTPASGVADEVFLCDVRRLPGAGPDNVPSAVVHTASDAALCAASNSSNEEIINLLLSADLILPALEDKEALDAIVRLSNKYGLPLAFSPDAYAVSSSKLKSDALIHRLGIPSPAYAATSSKLKSGECIHRCEIPSRADADMPKDRRWIVKPSEGSGSRGVKVFPSLEEAQAFAKKQTPGHAPAEAHPPADAPAPAEAHPPAATSPITAPARATEQTKTEDMVVQEYLDGPSYSIEVIGGPGSYRTYAITQIHVDEASDCNLVTTPCNITPQQDAALRRDTVKLAESTKLYGVMDVEVILHNGEMKVLEIDARIPSQTPAAVLASTGVNMLEEIMALAERSATATPVDTPIIAAATPVATPGTATATLVPTTTPRYASYENIIATRESVVSKGEHIMGKAGPLTLRTGWCGADESMTDYREGCPEFRGIFINAADTESELARKRSRMYEAIAALMRRKKNEG